MAQNQLGQSLGAMLGQFAFGGNDPKASMKGMLDGARAGYYDASAQNSLASKLKAEAEAEQLRRQNEAQQPANLLRNAMAGYGVPTDEAPAVENFMRSGNLGGKYEPELGPAMPQPKWAGPGEVLPGLTPSGVAPGYQNRLPDVARSIQGVQTALTIGDKNSENIAKAGAINREGRLSDDIIAGRANRNTVGGAQAASTGKDLFHADSSGGVLDKFGGQLDTTNPLAQATINLRKEQAGAAGALTKQRTAGGGGGKAPVGYRYTANEDGEVTLEPIPGGPKDPKNIQAKPMPSTALKMQQEELDAIGSASSTDADLVAISKQLEDGKLVLGPVKNVVGQARNFAGRSTEQSRNLASFKATLEKLRNDSLRLNKGVQTEGDSQRAWNELVSNINDPQVVQQRLGEIRAINKRAVDLRKLNIETLRSNFGQPPLDTSGQTNVAPAVGGGGKAYDADKERRYQEWKARQAK